MKKIFDTQFLLETKSEANISEHWSKKSNRHKKQAKMVWFEMLSCPFIIPPCKVSITRISPRTLDDDNLRTALKWIRDAIAEKIHPNLAPGRADDDKLIEWDYLQWKGKPKAIRIEIYQPETRYLSEFPRFY